MPVYEFECATCGVFPDFRPIDSRDLPAMCGRCDSPAPRIISAPNLAVMSPLQRMAATRNDRSQHEPRVGPKASCCSGSVCSHKRTGLKVTPDGKPALRASKKKNRRPWMLGH